MDKYLQIIASASLFRGIAKTEIAAVAVIGVWAVGTAVIVGMGNDRQR